MPRNRLILEEAFVKRGREKQAAAKRFTGLLYVELRWQIRQLDRLPQSLIVVHRRNGASHQFGLV